jgi:site-specific recombinase XerD
MKEYCEVNLKPETIKNYRKRIKNHIKPEFGRYKLKSITSAVLQAFINKLFNQGFSRTSLANFKGILSKAFLYAIEPLKFIKDSPMLYVKLPSPRAPSKIKTRKKTAYIFAA